MLWAIGIGGVFLYVSVLFTFGLVTLGKGRGWLFLFGVFFPVFWLIGAVMQPAKGY